MAIKVNVFSNPTYDGFADAKKRLKRYSIKQLEQEYQNNRKDTHGRALYSHNAKQYNDIIVKELHSRGIQAIPLLPLFGKWQGEMEDLETFYD